MNVLDIFKFRKQPPTAVVGDETPETAKARVGLYEDVAINELVQMMVKVPDIDEVLKQAGVPRHRLRVLMYDDEIAQAVETRADAITGLSLRLEPTETEQAKFVLEQITPHLQSLVLGAFQSRLFGFSIIEAVYSKLEDGRIGFKFLGVKPMEWFSPQPDGGLLYFVNGWGTGEGILVDQRFKFFMTRNKATYENPYGEALLSRLYWPWFFRQNGWKFWGKFLERFGAPLLVGKSSDPTAMVNALLMAHSQAVIGVGIADDVTAIGPQGGNSGQAFDQFETALLRRIQKVVLGQTLTSGTDGGSGNRALGQVHNNVREDKLDSDIKLVLPTIQRAVDAICLLNGFKPIRAVYSTETTLESGRALRDKDLYAVGVRFEASYFQDNYGLAPEDFTLSSESDTTDEPKLDKDGNVIPPEKKPAIAKAGKNFALTFAKEDLPLTKNQRMVEDAGDEAIENAGQPLETDLIRTAVLAASSPEDLEERLMVLFESNPQFTREQFSKSLEEALRQVQILGYVQSENG